MSNEMPGRPVLSPVDYAAWNKGYMPTSEHILIDQLMFRGAKVRFSSDDGKEGAFWFVTRGRKIRHGYARKIMELMLDAWEPECSPETNSLDTSSTTTDAASAEPTATTAQTSAVGSTDASEQDGAAENAGTGYQWPGQISRA